MPVQTHVTQANRNSPLTPPLSDTNPQPKKTTPTDMFPPGTKTSTYDFTIHDNSHDEDEPDADSFIHLASILNRPTFPSSSNTTDGYNPSLLDKNPVTFKFYNNKDSEWTESNNNKFNTKIAHKSPTNTQDNQSSVYSSDTESFPPVPVFQQQLP